MLPENSIIIVQQHDIQYIRPIDISQENKTYWYFSRKNNIFVLFWNV